MSAYPISVEQGNKCTLTTMNDKTQYLHILNGNRTLRIGCRVKYRDYLFDIRPKTLISSIAKVNIHHQYFTMESGDIVSFQRILEIVNP